MKETNMNLRNVLRTYALLRQLTDDETALLNILRGMNDSERELLVESLSPQKAAVKKRRAAAKSPRAQSLAAAIQQTPKIETDTGNVRCAGEDCNARAADPIHDPAGGYFGYHEFVAPDAQAAGVGD